MSKETNFKSGYVTLVGLPNAGKSTLLNRIVGCKLAAVSRKPQTTRESILGIFTTECSQILFMDTPGYHTSRKNINGFLMKEAIAAYRSADVIVYLFDSTVLRRKGVGVNNDFINSIQTAAKDKDIIPVLSKVDLIKKGEIKKLSDEIMEEYNFSTDVIPISVARSMGIVDLLSKTAALLPYGPQYYPEDELTDRDLRFLCSEIIREKVFRFIYDEVPYSTSVEVAVYEEKDRLHRIFADIYVEKQSQKGILVGKGGEMIKRIGSTARCDIERLVESKVYLGLNVRVKKD